MSPITWVNELWQVVRDLYKHLQTFSGLSPIYLNFSDFSCSDLEIFTKSSGGELSNATWPLPLPSLSSSSSQGLGPSSLMRYHVRTLFTSFCSLSNSLCTPATGPQHEAPHATPCSCECTLFILLAYVLTFCTFSCLFSLFSPLYPSCKSLS
jgi:hypothetical protein